MNNAIQKLEYLTWMENFYCNNLTFDHYEILTVGKIPKKELKREPELMNTKWFDYRLMHPMMATYYFYHQYTKAYQKFWAKAINYEAAPFIYPFKGEGRLNFLKAREALSIWRLRQAADLLGIRYDFFIECAINKIYRMQAGGRIVPPRPSMLMSEDLLSTVLLEWKSTCEASLQIACSPYFRISNFLASKTQLDHEQFVINQIKQRKIQHYSLSACLHQYEVVRLETALSNFDERTVYQAVLSSGIC